MKLIIKRSDLHTKPCDRYDDLPDEFDAIAEIGKRGGDFKDARWLIESCTIAQTLEMIEYYKSLNPNYTDVSWLIENCTFAQTLELLKYYKGLNPIYLDVRLLISLCPFASQHKELLMKGLP